MTEDRVNAMVVSLLSELDPWVYEDSDEESNSRCLRNDMYYIQGILQMADAIKHELRKDAANE